MHLNLWAFNNFGWNRVTPSSRCHMWIFTDNTRTVFSSHAPFSRTRLRELILGIILARRCLEPMLLWSGYIYALPCPNLKRGVWPFYSSVIWWVVGWTRFRLLLLAFRMVLNARSHRVAWLLLSDEGPCTVVSGSWNIEFFFLLAVWCTEAEFRCRIQSHFFLLCIVSWAWRDWVAI